MAKHRTIQTRITAIILVLAIAFAINAWAPTSVRAQTPEPDGLRVTHAELPFGWELFDYSGGFVPGDPWIDLLFIHPDPAITVPHVTLFLNRYPAWVEFTMTECLAEAEDFDLTMTTLFGQASLRLVEGSGETESRESVDGFDAEIREQRFEVEEWVPGTAAQPPRWEWISSAWIRNYCIDLPASPVSIALVVQPEHYPEAIEFIETLRFNVSGDQETPDPDATAPPQQIAPTPTPTIEATATPEPTPTVAIEPTVPVVETPAPEPTATAEPPPLPDPPDEPVMGIGIPLSMVALLFGLAALMALVGIGLVTFLVVMGVRSRRARARGDATQVGREQPDPPTSAGAVEQPLPTDQPGRVCRNCGAPVEHGDAFCTSCGAAVEEEEPESAESHCQQCGQPLNPDSRFCTACGARIDRS
jgi:hypothetical protein